MYSFYFMVLLLCALIVSGGCTIHALVADALEEGQTRGDRVSHAVAAITVSGLVTMFAVIVPLAW